MDVMITNNQLAERFEIAQNGSTAILEYIVTGGLITLVHTEVPEEFGGKGFGGKLVKFALEYAKRNNLKVVAHCEFLKVTSAATKNFCRYYVSSARELRTDTEFK